ncbi:polyadenylate-binding protein RBP47-like, partial [Papaver somniferum]|uniref:polyadenylate-binding protein RBP47-like n=1 Tax=Papaver somniferum TaxID=3469 RepID=UPI000E6FBEC2
MVPQRKIVADSQQKQQQWMGMQYPAETMVVQHPYYHQMIPHQPFQPQIFIHYPSILYHQQQSHLGSPEENRTIWVGHLHYWMEENYLHSCFAHTVQVVSVKVIRNKRTGQSEGYGFVEFCTGEAAEDVLQTYNGSAMPYAEQPFRLNWASIGIGDRRCSDRSVFVGNLASDVTDILLQGTFASQYPSVRGAKVVKDANTGRSKDYGFVRFGDAKERTRAIAEMDGVYCSSRPMRVATARKSNGFQQSQGYVP